MESYHANEARLKMREILTTVERGEHIELKRYDTPTAIVVPIDWYEHQRAALAAFSEADDPPVSATEVRGHVVMLAGLLAGLRNNVPLTEPLGNFWRQLNSEVAKLADLLPENAEKD